MKTQEPEKSTADDAAAEPVSRALPSVKNIEDRIILNTTRFDKTDRSKSGCKLGSHGYQLRQNADGIIAIAVHTSNGNKGQTAEGVAKFLMESHAVAAHYVIDKPDAGGNIAIYQVVPPYLAAWACGDSEARGYSHWNEISISIEIVNAGDEKDPMKGEAILEDQKAACAWLCMYLRRQYPRIFMLERHADIAVPRGRKPDPNLWTDPADPSMPPDKAWAKWVHSFWKDPS